MTLIEIYSDPAGDYLGTVLADLERLPLKRFCGLFWWAAEGQFDESPTAGEDDAGGPADDFYDGGERHTDVW